jgi:glycosyltransferase involved in cell wall biosynthesis
MISLLAFSSNLTLSMIVFFIVVSLIGILGMTWLFPLIAATAYKLKKHSLSHSPDKEGFSPSITVIIPAHNEQTVIAETLSKCISSYEYAQKLLPPHTLKSFKIIVIADGCTDGTVEAVEAFTKQYSFLSLKAQTPSKGKWKSLVDCIAQLDCDETEAVNHIENSSIQSSNTSNSSWVAFTDAGALWPDTLLLDVFQCILSDSKIAGVSPSYDNSKNGFSEKILWSIERHFKSIESIAGGPISIHGATIFYRKKELKIALNSLKVRDNWRCDDVVIPMTLRKTFPEARIAYLSGTKVLDSVSTTASKNIAVTNISTEKSIEEESVKGKEIQDALPSREEFSSEAASCRVATSSEIKFLGNEFVRRKRMMIGNLEWFSEKLWLGNSFVTLLAMRRIFRVFWAYWFVSIGIAAFLAFTNILKISFFAGLMLLIASFLAYILISKALRKGSYFKAENAPGDLSHKDAYLKSTVEKNSSSLLNTLPKVQISGVMQSKYLFYNILQCKIVQSAYASLIAPYYLFIFLFNSKNLNNHLNKHRWK